MANVARAALVDNMFREPGSEVQSALAQVASGWARQRAKEKEEAVPVEKEMMQELLSEARERMGFEEGEMTALPAGLATTLGTRRGLLDVESDDLVWSEASFRGQLAGAALAAASEVQRWASGMELEETAEELTPEMTQLRKAIQEDYFSTMLGMNLGVTDLPGKVDREDMETVRDKVLDGLFETRVPQVVLGGRAFVLRGDVLNNATTEALMASARRRLGENLLSDKVLMMAVADRLTAMEGFEQFANGPDIMEEFEQNVSVRGPAYAAKEFFTGFLCRAFRPPVAILLVPAKTKPPPIERSQALQEYVLAGVSAVTLGLAAYGPLGEAWQQVSGGNLEPLLKAVPLSLSVVGLLGFQELGRALVAWRKGLGLHRPRLLPCPPVGLLGCIEGLTSYPKDRGALFDVAMAGPASGLFASLAATLAGLKLTAATPGALASHPVLSSAMLQKSILLSGLVDAFLNTRPA